MNALTTLVFQKTMDAMDIEIDNIQSINFGTNQVILAIFFRRRQALSYSQHLYLVPRTKNSTSLGQCIDAEKYAIGPRRVPQPKV